MIFLNLHKDSPYILQEKIESHKKLSKELKNRIKQNNMNYKQGFIYTYRKGNELISGIVTHVARHGERFWCEEVDPHGNIVKWNYSKSDLDRINS